MYITQYLSLNRQTIISRVHLLNFKNKQVGLCMINNISVVVDFVGEKNWQNYR